MIFLGYNMKIKEVIVVEGKSDLIFLQSFLDAEIIITNGSEISKKTLDLIKKANETRGVIILTDPDYPGIRIRNIISEYIGDCKHAFVEKSKAIRGKKVGIAETKKEDVLKALENVITYKKDSIKTVNESATFDDCEYYVLIYSQLASKSYFEEAKVGDVVTVEGDITSGNCYLVFE